MPAAVLRWRQPDGSRHGRSRLAGLQRILQDPDATVRFWAVRALGELDVWTPDTQAALLQLLGDSDADVRWAAADQVYRKGLGTAVETPRESD